LHKQFKNTANSTRYTVDTGPVMWNNPNWLVIRISKHRFILSER